MRVPFRPFLPRLRLICEDRGTTLVEFALLAPVLILLIAGGIELGRLALIKSTLETTTSSAARAILVDLEVSEDDRDRALRKMITDGIRPLGGFADDSVQIETKVYRSFGESYPESFSDLNGNGQYDGPNGTFGGEPFDDRNRNGRFDLAVQREGKLGGAGDVVSYQVRLPVQLLFGFLARDWGMSDGIVLQSEIVLRNEPVKTSRRTR